MGEINKLLRRREPASLEELEPALRSCFRRHATFMLGLPEVKAQVLGIAGIELLDPDVRQAVEQKALHSLVVGVNDQMRVTFCALENHPLWKDLKPDHHKDAHQVRNFHKVPRPGEKSGFTAYWAAWLEWAEEGFEVKKLQLALK